MLRVSVLSDVPLWRWQRLPFQKESQVILQVRRLQGLLNIQDCCHCPAQGYQGAGASPSFGLLHRVCMYLFCAACTAESEVECC